MPGRFPRNLVRYDGQFSLPRHRRCLHRVIRSVFLNSIFVWTTENHRMVSAEVVEWRRGRSGAFQGGRLPRIVGRDGPAETAPGQVPEKNELGRTGQKSGDGD